MTPLTILDATAVAVPLPNGQGLTPVPIDWTAPSRGGEWWDAGSPTQFVVPAGINFVTLNASIKSSTYMDSASAYVDLIINSTVENSLHPALNGWMQADVVWSGRVVAGDIFELGAATGYTNYNIDGRDTRMMIAGYLI